MRRTLFLIPHEIAGIPLFGLGWVLILVGLLFGLRMWWAKRSGRAAGEVLSAEGFVWGAIAVLVAFILPIAELKNIDGEPIGMAVRGYGLLLLAGVASAVGLAAVRAVRYGLSPEIILSLAPWVLVGGIVGARVFYVVQYHDRYRGDSFLETVRNMLVFTEGGLVVYGGIIGGFAAGIYFLRRHKLPVLTIGDVIIPCIFLGLFFGRLGCLMNGCCYGGRCEPGPTAVEFPTGSPVYQDQLLSGELIGLEVELPDRTVRSVRPGSVAENAGIRPGEHVELIKTTPIDRETARRDVPAESLQPGLVAVVGGKSYRWDAEDLPPRALPVVAAQTISSFAGLTLCLALLAVSRIPMRPGTLMFLGLACYAVVRFILEWVRVDEAGRFGTELSISQWVSVGVFCLAVAAMIWIRQQPREPNASATVS